MIFLFVAPGIARNSGIPRVIIRRRPNMRCIHGSPELTQMTTSLSICGDHQRQSCWSGRRRNFSVGRPCLLTVLAFDRNVS